MSEPFFERSDFEAVTRSERFIEAIATGQPVEFGDVTDRDTGDRALAALLEDWRDELRAPGGIPPEQDAIAALTRGLAERRRTRRRMRLVAAMAAAVLSIGGFGALMGQAQPGDPLYGIRTTVFGEPASVRDERIAVSAETDLDQVQQMIALGQWDQAQDKLDAVGDRVQKVRDSDRKQDLIDQMNLLHAKLDNHDPNATVPTSEVPRDPGITALPPNPVGG
jgi:hypothetical protein